MQLISFKKFWERSYVRTLVESGGAVYGMVKPLAVAKPLLAASGLFSLALGVEAAITVLLLCVSIGLASMQYRSFKLQQKLSSHNGST